MKKIIQPKFTKKEKKEWNKIAKFMWEKQIKNIEFTHVKNGLYKMLIKKNED